MDSIADRLSGESAPGMIAGESFGGREADMAKDDSQISRQARWQRKQRALGLCVLCSEPAFKGWRCRKHYELHKISMRLRYIPRVRGRYNVGGLDRTVVGDVAVQGTAGVARLRTRKPGGNATGEASSAGAPSAGAATPTRTTRAKVKARKSLSGATPARARARARRAVAGTGARPEANRTDRS
jgi:hypothetical protein